MNKKTGMTEFNEKIQNLQDRLRDLIFRINESNLDLSEADRISRIKRKFLNGPLAPLKISSIHQGNPEGTVKMVPQNGRLSTTLFIDDLLEAPARKISYRISNFDPKIYKQSGIGVIFQLDGIVRYEQIVFEYVPKTKDYQLIIKESPDHYLTGRLFVIFDFEVHPQNFSEKVDADPQPFTLETILSGGESRTNSKNKGKDQLTKSQNPFQ